MCTFLWVSCEDLLPDCKYSREKIKGTSPICWYRKGHQKWESRHERTFSLMKCLLVCQGTGDLRKENGKCRREAGTLGKMKCKCISKNQALAMVSWAGYLRPGLGPGWVPGRRLEHLETGGGGEPVAELRCWPGLGKSSRLGDVFGISELLVVWTVSL